MAELLLGIDGGGSKTQALLADRSGAIRGSGSAGSSNHQVVGFAGATEALLAAIGEAFQRARLSPETPIAAACFGLSGADRPHERAKFQEWAAQQRLAHHTTFVNDAQLVLAAGTPDGWGVALICGTGSICYGRAPGGHTTRAGGWGPLLGDEGSGYDIAVRALRLATKTADGRAQAHELLQTVLEHWGLEQPAQLIGYVYRPEVRQAEIAGLARRIVALADAGNHDAQTILEDAARELGQLVALVARKLDLRQPPLALGGGLLCASGLLRRSIAAHTAHELGPVAQVEEPARGAVTLARRLLEDTRAR